jgi:hypothetical protein
MRRLCVDAQEIATKGSAIGRKKGRMRADEEGSPVGRGGVKNGA